jgi:hypothetical protein
VFASRADEPGAAKLMAAPFEDVIKALDALKSQNGEAGKP